MEPLSAREGKKNPYFNIFRVFLSLKNALDFVFLLYLSSLLSLFAQSFINLKCKELKQEYCYTYVGDTFWDKCPLNTKCPMPGGPYMHGTNFAH